MIEISQATQQDSADIYAWRNDPLTRAMSITSDFVEWEDHSVWFTNSMSNRNRKLYIGKIKSEKVGVCRFDINPDNNKVEVSLNLSPSARGRKISSPFLKAAIDIFFQDVKSSFVLTATIKKSNTQSIKCFENVGFEFSNVDAECNHYVLEKNI